MADKFGRRYKLEVQTGPLEVLTVALPLTVEFEIARSLYSSANIASIRVYNLSAKNRNKLRKDAFRVDEYRQIVLRAGYNDNPPIIFQGNVTQAWSVREGTNFITSLQSLDGGFAFSNAKTSTAFPSNTPNSTVISNLAGSLPHVDIGSIGSYGGTNGQRGSSYSEPTTSILQRLTNGGFFIDNETAHCLNSNEVLSGQSLTINAQSGLLNTPVLEQNFLYFDMIFEPRLFVGQLIFLDSSTGDFRFNGPAKVTSLHHRGMISESVCGEAITTVGLDVSKSVFTSVEEE